MDLLEYTLPDDAALRGKRVLVMGLGLFDGGAAVVRFLNGRGARVTVTDLRDEAALKTTLDGLAGVPFERVLGKHRVEDFTSADLVIVNPAVPPDSPYLAAARAHGVPLASEIGMFLSRSRGRLALVTGSKGKSTTATLLHRMLRQAGQDALLGGNIGRSLLDQVDAIRADQVVVLEISSFQLEQARGVERHPEVVIITNVFPVHLDRHLDFEVYSEIKMSVMEGAACAVLNFGDDRLRAFGARGDADEQWFSAGPPPPSGFWLRDGEVHEVGGGCVLERGALRIPGRHNLENFMAALAAAERLGASRTDAIAAARDFGGVEHRLQQVAEHGGVRYVNDSIATTPEATIAALEAVDGPIVLLLGGHESGADLARLAQHAGGRVKVAVTFGASGPRVARALAETAPGLARRECATFAEAVAAARAAAAPGDAVLLSPSFPSYDQFRNFRERGERFCALVAPSSS